MPARANRRVKFTAEADDDIASAYYWYEEREIGLGEEFLRYPDLHPSHILLEGFHIVRHLEVG